MRWHRREHGLVRLALALQLCLPGQFAAPAGAPAAVAAGDAFDSAERVESARLYGNINHYAYYYTNLLVGSPHPQRVSVIVDTGSSLCGFPCEGCAHCGKHLDPPYHIARSASAKWIPCSTDCEGSCQDSLCSYTQSYTEGSSISGLWFHDHVQLGDAFQENPPVRATLGCHSDERKLFYTQRVNGIMGLAPHENSGRATILQDLFGDSRHVNTGIFSICLAEWGGKLSVGGWESRYHLQRTSNESEPEVQWMSLKHTSYYSVTPTAILIRGEDGEDAEITQASDDFGTTLVDSGTTFTYFPMAIFTHISAALSARCAEDAGCGARREGRDCWRLQEGETRPRHFPVLTMVFEGGVKSEWPPTAYLFQRGEPDLWCQAFSNNGADSDTVLGVSWMLHKDVIFDLRNSQLGVAAANCPEYRRPPGEELMDFGGAVPSEYSLFTNFVLVCKFAGLFVAASIGTWFVYSNCIAKSRAYNNLDEREETLAGSSVDGGDGGSPSSCGRDP